MESSEPREWQASPGTDLHASTSSDGGKPSTKIPDQGGEIMDIEYFSDSAEGKKKRRRGRLIIFGVSPLSSIPLNVTMHATVACSV